MLRFLLVVAVVAAAVVAGDDKQVAGDKEQLSTLQSLVGQWRGVGQPQRSSTKDSWAEEADWAWQFDKEVPSLVAKLPKDRYFTQFRLTAEPNNSFALVAKPQAGDHEVRYSGVIDDQRQLILTADNPRDDLPHRLSFRFVASDDRLLLLMEKAGSSSGQFVRLAEVGYTRQGSGFGKNVAQRECVVTGGLGTIEVTHNGKTYFVCCTGCRDYFNENPEKVLAEHAARTKSK